MKITDLIKVCIYSYSIKHFKNPCILSYGLSIVARINDIMAEEKPHIVLISIISIEVEMDDSFAGGKISCASRILMHCNFHFTIKNSIDLWQLAINCILLTVPFHVLKNLWLDIKIC
eukprot:c620_g1_i1 orf=210-560(+)